MDDLDLDWPSSGTKPTGLPTCCKAELIIERKPTSGIHLVADSVIYVDRSTPFSYPEGVKRVMHPELEAIAPSRYDVAKLEQWTHHLQKDGKCIEGNKIFTHLKNTNTLKTCVGVRDLYEIQKKGIVFYQKYFYGKAVFGWASVVQYFIGDLLVDLLVPYLCESDGGVVLVWDPLSRNWYSDNPALRHVSSTQAVVQPLDMR